ncbi:hypothetical protein QBK93_36920 [Rhizobium leguminosarum]|uniref:hypothetical protein n=1 Tax=Rhizobium leguminosarum TaxID=384 RepID=UPI0024A8FC4B|nr:hypothetical protein [Rhizobium leguminosarum]MDI5930168.1 hypothetical protein [Rhizobium leguminosarum]
MRGLFLLTVIGVFVLGLQVHANPFAGVVYNPGPGNWIHVMSCSTACNDAIIQVYTTQEIEQRDSAVANQALNASQNAELNMKQRVESLEASVKAEVSDALQKLPETIFSQQAKDELAQRLADTVSDQTRKQLEDFKASMKQEILSAVELRLANQGAR